MANSQKWPVVQVADINGNLLGGSANSDGSSTLSVSGGSSPANPVNVSVSAAVSATPKLYKGFALRETSGTTAAVVRIFDNASAASGTVLDEISLVASESAREFYTAGINTANGIYFQVVSGAVIGSVRTG